MHRTDPDRVATGDVAVRVPMSVLPAAAESSDDVGVAAAIRSESPAAETAQKHDVELAAVRAQLADAEARRAKLEQDLAAQVAAVRRKTDTDHAVEIAVLRARTVGEVEAARRRAEAALAAQERDLRVQEADQVEAAVRAAQAEAARTLVETMQQQDVALARAELHSAEIEQNLSATRMEADLAQAEVERLRAEHADQLERARREASGQPKLAGVEGVPGVDVQFGAMPEADLGSTVTPVTTRALTRRGMAELAATVVLAGVAGTFIGWCAVFSGIFF